MMGYAEFSGEVGLADGHVSESRGGVSGFSVEKGPDAWVM